MDLLGPTAMALRDLRHDRIRRTPPWVVISVVRLEHCPLHEIVRKRSRPATLPAIKGPHGTAYPTWCSDPRSSGAAENPDCQRAAQTSGGIWRDHAAGPLSSGPTRRGDERRQGQAPSTGGERAAGILSLIETAKRNGIDPEAYLRPVLARIADHPIAKIGGLLPWNLKSGSAAALTVRLPRRLHPGLFSSSCARYRPRNRLLWRCWAGRFSKGHAVRCNVSGAVWPCRILLDAGHLRAERGSHFCASASTWRSSLARSIVAGSKPAGAVSSASAWPG